MTTTPKRLPPWLRVPFRDTKGRAETGQILRRLGLHTVCEGANCPNQCQCWARRTATFMILGNECTRNCRFCAVSHGVPAAVAADEPERVATAAAQLQLRHVVITSVTRDDLADGGAAHFATTVRAVRAQLPTARIEVLTPDFSGNTAHLATVLEARPTVFNHNLETCRRLSGVIRSGAEYERSLTVLRNAAELGRAAGIHIKSGFMLGLGETDAEVAEMLADLHAQGVRLLTIGQYLAPSRNHWPVERYVTPEQFNEWGRLSREQYGFSQVASAPLVRSSYMAEDQFAELTKSLE